MATQRTQTSGRVESLDAALFFFPGAASTTSNPAGRRPAVTAGQFNCHGFGLGREPPGPPTAGLQILDAHAIPLRDRRGNCPISGEAQQREQSQHYGLFTLTEHIDRKSETNIPKEHHIEFVAASEYPAKPLYVAKQPLYLIAPLMRGQCGNAGNAGNAGTEFILKR